MVGEGAPQARLILKNAHMIFSGLLIGRLWGIMGCVQGWHHAGRSGRCGLSGMWTAYGRVATDGGRPVVLVVPTLRATTRQL